MSLVHKVSDLFKGRVYPKNWSTCELVNIASIQNGFPFKSNLFNTNRKGFPLLRIRDIVSSKIETFYDGDYLNDYVVVNGDLIVGMDGDFNHNMWSNEPTLLNQRVCRILPDECYIKKKFLYYGLGDFLKVINDNTSAVTVKHLSSKSIGEIPFPLPPLPEQERIVAKLDKLFAQHEKIKKALDRIPELLKAFRQQVLTQAVTGKLTEQWREGKKLGEWEKRLVKEITIKLGSGSTPRGGSATYLSEGIPLVRSMNVVFGGIKLDGLAFINEVQAAALKNVEIHFEDILLNITGASIGRLCLADKTVTGGRVNQHVFIIRTDRESIFPQFMEIYLRSNLIQGFIEEIKYGAGMEAISKSQIENLEINTPSLQEQQEIVRRVESLFAKADAIEERYKRLKEKVDHLPQAILHKAFKGELVPQLPTDGDAKDLLAEIMALKEETRGRKK